MLFYKIDTTLIDEGSLPTSRERDNFRTMAAEYKEKSDSFYHKIKEQRLLKGDIDSINDVIISTITAEDIEIPKIRKDTTKIKIGFAS